MLNPVSRGADQRVVGRRLRVGVFGVPVSIDIGVGFVAGLLVVSFGWLGVVATVAYLGSILLHELCHVAALERTGRRSSIRLHAFGGSASIRRPGLMTDRQHIVVALAGPVGQVVLVGVPIVVASTLVGVGDHQLVVLAVALNVWIAALNLMPLTPLDGGRVLEHGLRWSSSPHAERIGDVISLVAVALVVSGALAIGRIVIALYVVWLGVRHLLVVRAHRRMMRQLGAGGTVSVPAALWPSVPRSMTFREVLESVSEPPPAHPMRGVVSVAAGLLLMIVVISVAASSGVDLPVG